MTSTFVFEFFAWPQLDVFCYVTPLHSQTQGAWTSILCRRTRLLPYKLNLCLFFLSSKIWQIEVHTQGAFRLFKLPFQNCEFLA